MHVFELDLSASAAAAVEKRGRLVDRYHCGPDPVGEEDGEEGAPGRISVAASGAPGLSSVSFKRSQSQRVLRTTVSGLPLDDEAAGG